MPHVVTQSCCSDASCVYSCPVNCIQPTPDSPDFLAAEMLHIDPATCVDCGACVSSCPVDAIKPHTALAEHELPFLEINREYHSRQRPRPLLAPPPERLVVRRRRSPLRVAVVGSGPSGMYAADEILTIPGARVSMFERLDRPYGLARFGVAPDHERMRRISAQFDQIRATPRLTLHTGVRVGDDVSHEDLLGDHDAVIYAVGAAGDRRLEIPGIDLPGVASATEFVAWYNGHPDHAGRSFDLSSPRAVIVGNGNVALDAARILTMDPDRLADTEIAPRALAALRASKVEEVVVTGRRAPIHAAFTLPELVGLATAPGVDLRIEASDEEIAAAPKLALVRSLERSRGRRRVTLRFHLTPTAALGEEQLEAVEFGDERVDAGLLLTSIGYGAAPIPGLPFDADSRTVPNDRGRVIDPATDSAIPRTYVTGWIKRGPTGFLGTNRSDSKQTVTALVEDLNAGRLRSQPAYVSGADQKVDRVSERLMPGALLAEQSK